MNFDDALRDNQLTEMALRDVIASLRKMVANKDDRLERVLAGISPEQVAGWTEEEKQEYVQLVSSSFVQKIAQRNKDVANVLNGIARAMEKPAQPAAPAEQPAQPDSGVPSAAPTRRAGGTVSSNDPAIKQMQQQYFAAKTPEAKKALTDKWNADPVASRRYLSGKKTGYFK